MKDPINNIPESAKHVRQKRRTRMSAEGRRQQLIQVSLKLFSDRGFKGTTTKDIAAAAGVSESIIYQHFKDKEELYTAILDYKSNERQTGEWLKELREYANSSDDERFFGSLISRILEAYHHDPHFQRLMLYASLEGHDIARISHRSLGIPIYDFISQYIVKRQREGAFRRCDPGAVVFALVGMPSYYAIVKRLFGINLLKSSDKDMGVALTGILLHGLKNGLDPKNSKRSSGTSQQRKV